MVPSRHKRQAHREAGTLCTPCSKPLKNMPTASMPAHGPHTTVSLIATRHINSAFPISSHKVNHTFPTDSSRSLRVSMSTPQLQDDAVTDPSPATSSDLHVSREAWLKDWVRPSQTKLCCALLNQAHMYMGRCSSPNLFDRLQYPEGAAIPGTEALRLLPS